jgi:beta-N-acetylhexosaminidase
MIERGHAPAVVGLERDPRVASSARLTASMRRILPFALLALTLAGCAAAQSGVTAAPASRDAWVDSVLTGLSLRDKAAQMVWPWILGDFVPEHSAEWERLRGLVRDEHVGGFIVSVGAPLEIAAKLNALQRESQLPLLMSADYEYGAGFRARGAFFLPNAIDLGGAVTFPPPMAVAATGDTALAYEMGRVTAIEGRALGVHVAFAPVLDVNNNPANPVINTRSFGEDPKMVARFGVAMIHGLQEHGMLATGKHFPGHGDTETNSHLAMAEVDVPRARLDSVELVPFRAAIDAGVGAIMTFHGSLPALDTATIPATLSRPIMTGLLRGDLGFEGLIVTDAMDMGGVLGQRFGLAEAVKRAVAAGADVVLMPPDTRGAIDAIVRGVAEGRYPESRVNDAARRILSAKRRLGLDRARLVALDSVRALVGDSAHVASARRVAERSITLVRDSAQRLPLGTLARSTRVLSLTFSARPELTAGVAFNAELRARFDSLRVEWVDAESPAINVARLDAIVDSAEVVIVSSYVGASSVARTAAVPRAFADFVNGLARGGKRPIVVAFANPYLLQQMPDVETYVVAWSPFALSQQAAARALVGAIPIGGRLPISIPPLVAAGAGEMRDAMTASCQ